MKDYSAQATKYKKNEISFSTWIKLVLFFGIILGLGVFLGWVYKQPSNPSSIVGKKMVESIQTEPASKTIKMPDNKYAAENPIDKASVNSKNAELINENQDFTFYGILKNNPIKIDVKTSKEREDEKKAIAKRLKRKRVQVASFQNIRQARSVTVELLLLGFDKEIIEIESAVNGWHKILIGPFPSSRELAAAKDKLSNNGYAGYIEKVRK